MFPTVHRPKHFKIIHFGKLKLISMFNSFDSFEEKAFNNLKKIRIDKCLMDLHFELL